MLVAVASLHSPGTTAVAVGLAAHWPTSPGEAGPVVVELDPEGGEVAARWRACSVPGLADVAAAVASTPGAGPEALQVGVQPIEVAGGSVAVVCAPPGGRVVRQALPLVTAPGAKVLNPADGIVVADLGSLYADSPAWPVATAADVTVLVVTGTLARLAHLRARLDEAATLARLGPRAAVVVAEADYTAAEVAEVVLAAGLDIRLLGPAGPAGSLAAYAGRGRRGRRARRTWRDLAEAVDALTGAPEAAVEEGTA